MTDNWNKFVIELIKSAMKPGYLYGIGEDGNLYCIEAKLPKPGETMIMPPFHMPKEYATAEDTNVPATYDLLYEEGGAGTT